MPIRGSSAVTARIVTRSQPASRARCLIAMRIAIVLLAVVCARSTAHAECGVPTWIGTSTAEALPLHGSLYMFQSAVRVVVPPPELAWVGPRGETLVVAISDNVIRIDYDGHGATGLEVRPRFGDPHRFELSPRWTAPAAPPRVLQYWHHASTWTCSSSDSLMIQLDQATAAVRARWTFDGKTDEWLVPARSDDTRSAIELGKLNCAETTIPPDQLRRGGHLELVAIRLDGTEVPVTGLPPEIAIADMPTSEDGIDHAMIVPPAPTAKRREADSPTYAAAVLLIVAAGFVMAWR